MQSTICLLLLFCLVSLINTHAGHDHDHEHHHDHDHEHHHHEEPAIDEKDVVVLTSSNFDDVLAKNSHVLVEFYAPWCGHCKHLAPIYAELATSLKQENSPIVIAKIDAIAHEDVATKNNIQGFPTLKFFRNGSPIEYNGGRSVEEFAAWVKRKSGPSTTLLSTQDDIESFLGKTGTKLIAYVGKDHVSQWESAASSGEIEDFSIAHIDNPSLFMGFQAGSFSIHKPDEDVVKYSGKFTHEDIIAFIKLEGYPAFRLLDQDLWTASQTSQTPLLAIFINADTTGISAYKDVATTFKGRVLFSHHPSLELAERWGASGKVVPTAILIIWKEGEPKFSIFNEETTFNADSLSSFVTDSLAGTYVGYQKSQPIPEDNSGPVFVLVGKQFDEIVYDTSKDVFVEFYAPWCGHCKQLAPIWEELGAEFANHKDKIIIAEMDATANTPSDKITIEGFPTIIYFPTNNKEGIVYEGDRDLESMKDFVLAHGGNKVALKAAIGIKEDL